MEHEVSKNNSSPQEFFNPPVDEDKYREEKCETIRAVKVKMDSIRIYEISEYDLSELESGEPNSVNFSFATLFFGMFVSSLLSMLTVDFGEKTKLFIVFCILTFGSFVTCMVLFVSWFLKRKNMKNIIAKIRGRQ